MINRLKIGALEAAISNETENSVDKRVRMVYEGSFESMEGPVVVTKDNIEKLAENHNNFLSKLSRLVKGDVPVSQNPPIQLDHSTSARDTVGRLIGNLEVGEYEEEGKKLAALFGNVRFLGKENVEKAKDGRYSTVSIGANFKNNTISELSITPFPAAPNATLLSKPKDSNEGEEEMDIKKMREKVAMYDKCRSHLMETEKLSEEDADKKLAEMDDEGMSKMSAEHDDKLKKLAEQEVKDKEEKEKQLSQLSAHKDKGVQLLAKMKSGSDKAMLAAKKSAIGSRLSALKSSGKITPAEIKKLDISQLAAKDQATVEEVLKTYDQREPQIMTGLIGSVKALTAAQLQTKLGGQDKEWLEIQTMLNMPSKKTEGEARLKKYQDDHKKLMEGQGDVSVQVDAVPQGQHTDQMGAEHDKAFDEMKLMMDQGKHEDAKAHFKKYLAAKTGGAVPGMDSTEDTQALANEYKEMQNEVTEFMKLMAPTLGIKPEELV